MVEREEQKNEGDEKQESLFTILAKTIASRWKTLSAEEKVKYEEMADEDMKRYRKEMDEYHQMIAERSRIEAANEARRQEEARANMAANPAAFQQDVFLQNFFTQQQQGQQQPFYGTMMPGMMQDPNMFAQLLQLMPQGAQQGGMPGNYMDFSAFQGLHQHGQGFLQPQFGNQQGPNGSGGENYHQQHTGAQGQQQQQQHGQAPGQGPLSPELQLLLLQQNRMNGGDPTGNS